MDFLKSFKTGEKNLKKSNLHDERISKQKKTYTRWVNNVLQDCKSNHRVRELYDDLRNGIILSDIVYAFTGVKLKTSIPLSVDDKAVMSSNLSLVLEAMRNDGVDLVNNNIGDIIDGKPKIILGLIWQMILHYDIRRSIQYHQELSYSDPDQSFSSFENGSVKSYKSSPTSKIKNVVMSPINSLKKRKEKKKKTIERGQCNKIILTWLEKEICIPYGIKITNFSSDWKDGVAFMALIHRFCPSLVDMDTVKVSPPHVNISEAFRYASECLNIKNILEVEDVLCDLPEDSAITLYVSQFMGIDALRVKEENKSNVKINEELQSSDEISLSDDSGNVHENNTIVVEKVVIREEDIEEEITKRQFLLASGPLSTVSEESCEDVSMDSYYPRNTCKPTKDVVYEDADVYPVEYIRGQNDSSMLSSTTNDSVFERSSFSKDIQSNKGNHLFSENNNLPSSCDYTESYDRGLANIFSSIFGDGTSQDDRSINNLGDVESATCYVQQLTSSVGLGMEICENNSTSFNCQSSDDYESDDDVIECCLDEMSPVKNRSFFDDSQGSNSTSETVIESTTSVNLDVVETVEHLVDVVSLLLDNELSFKPMDEMMVSTEHSDTDTTEIENEELIEEDLGCCGDINVISKLDSVKETKERLNSRCEEGEGDNACEDNLSGTHSPSEDTNNNFRLMSWLISPIEKVYEIMNDSTPLEGLDSSYPILKARSLQDCDAEQNVDVSSEELTGNATLDLNTSYSVVNQSLTAPDNTDDLENVGDRNDLTVGSLLDKVDHVKKLVEDIASIVPPISGTSAVNNDLSNSINGELVSLDFPEKTIEEQIKDLAETAKTLSDAYIERLQEIDESSESRTNNSEVSSNGVESFTDTETPDDEYEDLPPLTFEHTIKIRSEFNGNDMGSNSKTDSLSNKNTTLRRRYTTLNEVDLIKDSDEKSEGNIKNDDNKASISQAGEVRGTRYSYGFSLLLLFVLILSLLAYLIYDCSTCSSNCHSTSSSLCCISFQMKLHKLRGQVPF
ncbi:Spectrin beta chain, erythrocytic [Strongyloides ratti]|uniref:Spectrin beta chain, erythrocytic n=1 Tax=Strongyloides ratti TaxID=34506 RepID=A0A090L907_STRRB|nr:Spectrin beta chain, erythrocytic [Strongyloides ratti]CEF64633.1 Spectrin beta chain, erythrocytic [Strongyloides ratti]